MLSNDSTRFRKACIFTTLRFVKTHALSLLGTTRLLSRSGGGTDGLMEVRLADSTLRSGEPVTWGSGQQLLNRLWAT
jgi:hypothetical protein